MKKFVKIMLLSVILFGTASCSDDDEAQNTTLELTYVNLNGTWRLSN